ncbi:hypothetical protein CVT25_015005, partial [Psilocybe cyanescens]
HILGRQETHPISYVFRFSIVNAKRKGYEPIRTHYPDDSQQEESGADADADASPSAAGSQKPKPSTQKKGKRKAQNTDGKNVFRIGDGLLQMSPALQSEPDILAHIPLAADKGKEKAIGLDPDVVDHGEQWDPDLMGVPPTFFHLPEVSPANNIHGGHKHLNPWDWGTNVEPYHELSYNACQTVSDPFAAGPSNAEIPLGPLNADPDDRLDNMAYIRNFSDSQNMFYNSQTVFGNENSNLYRLQNTQGHAFMSNLNDNSDGISNPIAAPFPVPDYDEQHAVVHGSDNVNSPLMYVESHIKPPRTKRKSRIVVPIPSSSVVTEVPLPNFVDDIAEPMIGAGSGAGAVSQITTRLDQEELRLSTEDSIAIPANIKARPSTGTERSAKHSIGMSAYMEARSLIEAEPGAGAGIVSHISRSETLHAMGSTSAAGLNTEDAIALPAVSTKRAVRTSDTLALLESESDRLRVSGLHKRIRRIRE